MVDALRLGFIAFYAIASLVFLVKILPAAVRHPEADGRVRDTRRLLPYVLVPTAFAVPLAILLSRIGEWHSDAVLVRLIGAMLGLYAAALLLSAAGTLG